MARSTFGKYRQHLAHNGEAGQSIIILAIGFIALVMFVGIVVDVSLMFVRYTALSRAVDSAAIAAAGEMRSDRNFAQVGLAARQMIELHGLNPEEVKVETCQTAAKVINPDTGAEEDDRTICPLGDERKLVRVSSKILSPTVFMRLLGEPFRVIELSAVAVSETAVLDVVVVLDVSESMLHDTTYQDWANIGFGQVYVPPVWATDGGFNRAPAQPIGVFQRMLVNGYFHTIFPEINTNDDFDDVLQFWNDHLTKPQQVINNRLVYEDTVGPRVAEWGNYYRVRSFPYPGSVGQQRHPREECRVRFWPYSQSIRIPEHIRSMPEFRSRYEGPSTPGSQWLGWAPAFDFYGCCNDPTAFGRFDPDTGAWGPMPGYTLEQISPTNSPNVGDWDFSDLICQPFKQARDATAQFIRQVDFERGDRLAFVTFAQNATIIDPDGEFGCPAETCAFRDDDGTIYELYDKDTGLTKLNHMIESRERALDTLYRHIGVRAEGYFYRWNENGGGWNGFALGVNEGRSRYKNFYETDPNRDADGDGEPDILLNDYPVRDNCPFQNAALPSIFSLYSLWDWDWARRDANGNPIGPVNLQYSRDVGLLRIMTPNPREGIWAGTDLTYFQSYELWASCGYTNFGAGLREANNALLDPETTRRTGTVWVIIFMGDGATATSDIVRLNGRKPQPAEPYRLLTGTLPEWPAAGSGNFIRYGLRGEYGAFGLCPLGTPDRRSQLTRTDRADIVFPFCSDEQPHTRHFCRPPDRNPANVGKSCNGAATGAEPYRHGFAPGSFDRDYDCAVDFEINLSRGNVFDVDIGTYYSEDASTCDPFYDVDDYARDWADYVGLARPGAGDQQLPTIFTIGFGINFDVGSNGLDPGDIAYEPGPASLNIPDFLGEELLRYIADVGDNNRIDTDYQQDWLEDGTLDGALFDTGNRFGLRGPCEDPDVRPVGEQYPGTAVQLMGNGFSTRDGGNGTMVRPLPPRQDCGNYYNAPDQTRLTIVFNDIASRMFTRLAP